MATKKTEVVEKPKENGKTELAKVQPSYAERFTQMVMKEFPSGGNKIELTNFQKKLCQNYFIKIDQTLKAAEIKRLATDEKYRADLEIKWENVNMQKLATDVIAFSSVGLDPIQPNQLHFVPYNKGAMKKYDINFTIGYNGLEIKAKKYGLDVPKHITIEVVCANDKFKQIKKDMNHPIDGYTFEVVDAMNRGEIVGGFYYKIYDNAEKNECVVFTKSEIEKRKPKKASAEFWGGEIDIKKWSKEEKKMMPTGEKEVTDGWYEEMVVKTLKRAAWGSVTIDSEKIDAHYVAIASVEREALDNQVKEEIAANANKEEIGFTDAEEVKEEPKAIEPKPEPEKELTEEQKKEEAKGELGF